MPNDSVAGIILSKAKPCKLHLDDAVSVLGDLTLTSTQGPSMSMKDVESLVQRNVRQALLAVGYKASGAGSDNFAFSDGVRNGARGLGRNPPRGRRKRPHEEAGIRSYSTTCADCGEQGRLRGDLRCSASDHHAKRRRTTENDRYRSTGNEYKSSGGFRPGSRLGRRDN